MSNMYKGIMCFLCPAMSRFVRIQEGTKLEAHEESRLKELRQKETLGTLTGEEIRDFTRLATQKYGKIAEVPAGRFIKVSKSLRNEIEYWIKSGAKT